MGISPRSLARMSGVFQLLEGVSATFGQVVVLGRLVDFNSAATTAANLLSQERLFWVGLASCLVGTVCHLVWAWLMYELLKPVDRRLAGLVLIVMVVGCAIQAVTGLFYLAPMLLLEDGSSLQAFSTDQLQALALSFLVLNDYSFNIYLVFFGAWCLITGTLIFHSTFLPRLLGRCSASSGLGWLMFLHPPLARSLFTPYIAAASAAGELPLMLWLLIAGANSERWRQAERAHYVRQ